VLQNHGKDSCFIATSRKPSRFEFEQQANDFAAAALSDGVNKLEWKKMEVRVVNDTKPANVDPIQKFRPAVQLVNAEGIPAEGVKILVESIEEIAKGMKALSSTRLKRDAIVTLIARSSGIGRNEIDIVLKNLDAFEDTWLKPK
jgi:hypothetical protein